MCGESPALGQNGRMQNKHVVVRSNNPRRAELEDEGWVVVARSWAAELNASNVDVEALSGFVQHGLRHGEVREIEDSDVAQLLAIDAATLTDYPGGIATQHSPLTVATARITSSRRGFGVFDDAGLALAVTFVDITEQVADTDFTVVATSYRGLGIGSAIKAASVLALLREGVLTFRTGGAAENTAILAVNQRLGYVIDEEWVTLEAPSDRTTACESP